MRLYECDKCKSMIKDGDRIDFRYHRCLMSGTGMDWANADLCMKCYDKVRLFIKGGK